MFSPSNSNSHNNPHSGDVDFFKRSVGDSSKPSVNPGVCDQTPNSPTIGGAASRHNQVSVTVWGERGLESAVYDPHTEAFDQLGAARLATAQDNTVTSSSVYSHDSFIAGMPKMGDSLFEHHETPGDLQKLCPNSGPVAGYKHPADLAGTGGGAFMSRQRDREVEPRDPDWQEGPRDPMGINAPFGSVSQDPSSGW